MARDQLWAYRSRRAADAAPAGTDTQKRELYSVYKPPPTRPPVTKATWSGLRSHGAHFSPSHAGRDKRRGHASHGAALWADAGFKSPLSDCVTLGFSSRLSVCVCAMEVTIPSCQEWASLTCTTHRRERPAPPAGRSSLVEAGRCAQAAWRVSFPFSCFAHDPKASTILSYSSFYCGSRGFFC